MTNNSILILTGGTISLPFLKDYLIDHKFDTIIAVDSGLITADKLNLPIKYIVGDFDSVPQDLINDYQKRSEKDNSVTIKRFNPMKDETDTQIALKLAMELKAERITIFGGIGTRIDHMLANIHLLKLPLQNNIKAEIVDEHNKIYLINKSTSLLKNNLFGNYISFLPLTEHAIVTLQGFVYPLWKKDLYIGDSIGVSNEVKDSQADVIIDSGILIAIESKD